MFGAMPRTGFYTSTLIVANQIPSGLPVSDAVSFIDSGHSSLQLNESEARKEIQTIFSNFHHSQSQAEATYNFPAPQHKAPFAAVVDFSYPPPQGGAFGTGEHFSYPPSQWGTFGAGEHFSYPPSQGGIPGAEESEEWPFQSLTTPDNSGSFQIENCYSPEGLLSPPVIANSSPYNCHPPKRVRYAETNCGYSPAQYWLPLGSGDHTSNSSPVGEVFGTEETRESPHLSPTFSDEISFGDNSYCLDPSSSLSTQACSPSARPLLPSAALKSGKEQAQPEWLNLELQVNELVILVTELSKPSGKNKNDEQLARTVLIQTLGKPNPDPKLIETYSNKVEKFRKCLNIHPSMKSEVTYVAAVDSFMVWQHLDAVKKKALLTAFCLPFKLRKSDRSVSQRENVHKNKVGHCRRSLKIPPFIPAFGRSRLQIRERDCDAAAETPENCGLLTKACSPGASPRLPSAAPKRAKEPAPPEWFSLNMKVDELVILLTELSKKKGKSKSDGELAMTVLSKKLGKCEPDKKSTGEYTDKVGRFRRCLNIHPSMKSEVTYSPAVEKLREWGFLNTDEKRKLLTDFYLPFKERNSDVTLSTRIDVCLNRVRHCRNSLKVPPIVRGAGRAKQQTVKKQYKAADKPPELRDTGLTAEKGVEPQQTSFILPKSGCSPREAGSSGLGEPLSPRPSGGSSEYLPSQNIYDAGASRGYPLPQARTSAAGEDVENQQLSAILPNPTPFMYSTTPAWFDLKLQVNELVLLLTELSQPEGKDKTDEELARELLSQLGVESNEELAGTLLSQEDTEEADEAIVMILFDQAGDETYDKLVKIYQSRVKRFRTCLVIHPVMSSNHNYQQATKNIEQWQGVLTHQKTLLLTDFCLPYEQRNSDQHLSELSGVDIQRISLCRASLQIPPVRLAEQITQQPLFIAPNCGVRRQSRARPLPG